jgi:hypothetical protein
MGTEPESLDAQKGTIKDIFARCLKKNEAQVQYVDCLNHVRIVKRDFNLILSIAGKPTSKITVVTLLINIYVNLLIPASILFYLFPCTKYVV